MSDPEENDPDRRGEQPKEAGGDPANGDGEADPKIIVDTDWKEQIAREKEAAEASEQDSEQDSGETDSNVTPPAADADDKPLPPPPASFDVLVSMLFTQAMAMLGQMPDPASGKTTVNKPFAKHYIDTLEMLGEKTKGNLTDQESLMLSEALHALRMMYVNVKS